MKRLYRRIIIKYIKHEIYEAVLIDTPPGKRITAAGQRGSRTERVFQTKTEKTFEKHFTNAIFNRSSLPINTRKFYTNNKITIKGYCCFSQNIFNS